MVRELASRIGSGSNRHVHLRPDRETDLPVTATGSDRPLREQDLPAAIFGGSVGGASVAGPALVPYSATVSSGCSPAPPALTGSDVRSSRRDPTTNPPGHNAVGRVAAFWQCPACVSLSDTAANLILTLWRSGTEGERERVCVCVCVSTYSSAWCMWSRWCGTRGITPFTTPLAAVLNCLTDRFDTGCRYRGQWLPRARHCLCHFPNFYNRRSQWTDCTILGRHFERVSVPAHVRDKYKILMADRELEFISGCTRRLFPRVRFHFWPQRRLIFSRCSMPSFLAWTWRSKNLAGMT